MCYVPENFELFPTSPFRDTLRLQANIYIMTGRIPTIKFLQRIRDARRRQLIQNLTREVWNTPDCAHFTDVLVK